MLGPCVYIYIYIYNHAHNALSCRGALILSLARDGAAPPIRFEPRPEVGVDGSTSARRRPPNDNNLPTSGAVPRPAAVVLRLCRRLTGSELKLQMLPMPGRSRAGRPFVRRKQVRLNVYV